MRIYGVQFDIAWEDKAANFRKVEALLDAHAIEPDGLIVLPEMFAAGFSMNVAGIQEREGGETEAFVSKLAKKHRCWLAAGVVTPGADGKGRNEQIIASPGGAVTARYAKMQPFTFAGEGEHYSAGDSVALADIGGFAAAPFVCFDLRFPELFREAARLGANLYTVIANWPAKREHHWKALLTARAIENQACVIGVNRCGSDPYHTYTGGSMIVGPGGETLAEAGVGETVFSAVADAEQVEAYRRELPFLRDMRRGFRFV